MAYITFQPSDYFNTKLYTGTGSSLAITSVGFQPDWTWIYNRSGTYASAMYDAVRGVTKHVESTGNSAEQTVANTLTSFDSDGFTLGADTNSYVNRGSSPNSYVAWNWKANGQGSANSDGTINTTYTSHNSTSGLSIIQYNGNGSAGATIGHGGSVAPKCVIIKRTDTTSNWIFGTGAIGFTKFLYLNTTDASTTNSGTFNNTAPSSSVITLGSWNDVNNSSGTYIAYCFAEKKGFSKFGQYSGNSNADGKFVYLGFKPAWILVKKHYGTTGGAGAGDNWEIIDTKRDTFNVANKRIFPNVSNAESSSNVIDIVSNGFKIRTSSGGWNEASNDYIYMAFAEHPLVSSNDIPATAR